MKITFGFDIGVASIGWAAIGETTDNENGKLEILDAGVRVVPLETEEVDEFKKGGSVPTNVERRRARGVRRGLQRFRQRRNTLARVLSQLGMMPDEQLHKKLPPVELYSLRARALHEPLTLQEIGRVMLHLNLRRGFRSSRKAETDKKDSEYKEEIKQREAELSQYQQTIGQRFTEGLRTDAQYRVRQQIFNRSTYIDEFDQIWRFQSAVHPTVLTESARKLLRDRIIYMQRPLKSAKGLVGECALEWNYALDKQNHKPIVLANGLNKVVRPKCAPKSSPLAQECKIWEGIHNIRIYDEFRNNFPLTDEHKRQIFNILQQEEKSLSSSKLLKDVLKLSASAYSVDNLVDEKGLEGNKTRAKLLSVFRKTGINRPDLLVFDPKTELVEWGNTEDDTRVTRVQLCGDFDRQPLYELWHLIYATQEDHDLIRLLQEKYDFTYDQAKELAAIDFTSAGYARKSHRAMRRLLPHYQRGLDYTAACSAAGYKHSDYMTATENLGRSLLKKLEIIPKNKLRNPVVEKILNQLIHVVNELIERYGNPDEICVELARELRQSAREREEATKQNYKREKEHKLYRTQIAELLGIPAETVTKAQIKKWKLGLETEWKSLYTGKKIDCARFLSGEQIDVEHIIPRVRRFDDSFANKTICESRINQEKGDMTANDFMKAQRTPGLQPYEDYLKMLKSLNLSKTKYRNLTMTAEDVASDTDFIARQLRETQYITKEARTMLIDVTRTVRTTTGGITDFLRHQWGWDEVIHDTRLDQFREIGKTKTILIRKGTREKEVIEDWNKRMDHRHHALDALVTACTTQAHVHRLNNLNQTLEGKKGMDRRDGLRETGRDKFIAGKAPFSRSAVTAAVENILISYKQSRKVATRSRNNPKGSKKEPQITLTPRGALHKETIYGQIKRYGQPKLLDPKFRHEWIDNIAHEHQRELVKARIAEYGGDIKKAFKDLDKSPILYGKNGQRSLKKVTLWEKWYVAREAISQATSIDKISQIVDGAAQSAVESRIREAGGNLKVAFSDLSDNPIIAHQFPLRRVRILNSAKQMIKLPRGYAMSSENHHIAFYRDVEDKLHLHTVNFWDAYLRSRLNIPVIIKDVPAVYAYIEQTTSAIPEDLKLPEETEWTFVTSLMKNDMFIIGIDVSSIDITDHSRRNELSKYIYRVQSISSDGFIFTHHLETSSLRVDQAKYKSRMYRFRTAAGIDKITKIKIDRLGKITGITS